MHVAVAHAAAVDDERVVEHAAVAVGRRLQRGDELGELLDVELVQPGVLGDLLRLAAVVRQLVVALGDPQRRVGLVAALAAHHQREDAREVGLIRHGGDVEEQADVLLEGFGHAERRVERHVRAVLLLGPLDAALDLADVVEIVPQPGAVARAQAALQLVGVLADGVQDAAVLAHPRGPLFAGAGPAEEPLERHARVHLSRQRRRRARPGQRVGIGAAVVGAAGADEAGEVLDRQLDRRERRVLADLLGDHLIGGGPEIDVLALGGLGDGAAQPARGRGHVRVGGLAARPRRVGHQDRVILERLERLQDGREVEALPGRRRRPLVHDGAVRDVDRPEPFRGVRGRLHRGGHGRHHRLQERQRHGDARPPQEGPARQRPLRDEHGCGSPLCSLAAYRVATFVGSGSGAGLMRIWNGALVTIPRTRVENL